MTLPCPAFPIHAQEMRPVRTTAEDGRGIIFADRTPRVVRERIRVVIRGMNPTRLAYLEALWNDGLGACEPFNVQLPDDAAPRQVLFAADTLVITRRSANAFDAEFELVDAS